MSNEGGNTSQQHGTDIENLMKAAHMFPGACNTHRSGVSVHDIEGKHDPLLGLDTSVKATGGNSIALADAPRFYEINVVRRFLVCQWMQTTERKKMFTKIHEIIVPLGILRELRGDLTAAEVLDFHMRIASFGEGKKAADAARAERDWIKDEIKGRHGKINFEFKIDDFKQRRLQLSIGLDTLIAAVAGKPDYVGANASQQLYTLHDEEFCQYVLPIPILSPQRRIDKTLRQIAANADEQAATLFAVQKTPSAKPTRERTAAKRTPQRQDDKTRAGSMDQDLQKKLFGS